MIVMELLSLTTSIDEKLVEVNFKDKSGLRPWATFKMMLNFIHLFCSTDVLRKEAECVGLPQVQVGGLGEGSRVSMQGVGEGE